MNMQVKVHILANASYVISLDPANISA